MFTLEQIQYAHAKVSSGADFPKYIQDIIQLGVTWFETFVHNNQTDYYGHGNFSISSQGSLALLAVAEECHKEQFISDLKTHQQGQTDYPTFLKDCAKSGIQKWIVLLDKMTCTYYDSAGNEVLVESIPTVWS